MFKFYWNRNQAVDALRVTTFDSWNDYFDASVNQMNQQIFRGQAPDGIRRVDRSNTAMRGSQDEVHFDDGRALNRDGTWKHNPTGSDAITNAQRDWLTQNGWTLP